MLVSAATNRLDNLYTDLTSQIRHSVEVIKNKSEFTTEVHESKTSDSRTNHVGSFAFGYLEPSTAYNIHIVSAQVSDSGQVKKEQTPQQEIDEKANDSTPKTNEEIEETSFWETLQNQVYLDSQAITKIYRGASFSGYSELPLFMEGRKYTTYASQYASQAYNFAYNIVKEPDSRIEYMYKYDKSFDYRI